LAEHPLPRVQQAVESSLRRDALQVERIIALVQRPVASGEPAPSVTSPCHSSVTPLCQYEVPLPDLGRFDQLLSQGESEDGR
jgi:hypothetical protein